MLPDGWSNQELKDIVLGNIQNGYSPNPSDKPTGFYVLGLGALGDDGLITSAIKNVDPTSEVIRSQLKENDFLISRSNTPDKVGRSAIFKGEIDNCSYPDLMMRFRIDENKADISFIESKLISTSVRAYFKRCAAGSSSTMVKINKGVVERTPLLLPPIFEQKKIAEVISAWSQAISTTEQLLANSQQQKKAFMQQLLTGKKRFPGFTGKWEHKKLKHLCKVAKGEQLNRDTLTGGGRYPVINGGITPSGYTNDHNAPANTITISEGGNSCGFVGFQSSQFWCGGHCYALETPKLDPGFLYQLLKFNEVKIMRLRVGSGLPNIQKKDIDSLELLYPTSPEEIKNITEILNVADGKIYAQQQELLCLKQEKKSLMQQLLTGKRRVSV